MKTIIALFLLTLISCGGTKKNTSTQTTTSKQQVAKKQVIVAAKSKKTTKMFETLIEAQVNGFTNPQIWVIKEPKALQKIYKKINTSKKPKYALPKVDFNTATIVAIFMGEKNTGGYSVKVTSVVENENEITVKIKETHPKPNEIVTMIITQPFTIVKINNTNKPVEIVK